MRKLLIYLLIAFFLFSIVYVTYTQSLFAYNTLPRFLSSIIILSFCIYFLYKDFSNPDSIGSTFNFNIAVGMMLYFSSSSVLFGLSQSILKDRALNIFIWNIHATIMLVMYLIFAWAFLRLKKVP
ncbi:hypothetical protein ACTJIJ_13880 [Niabella sp. 22666]|uniref:hypothetical protein n=1 Tax=Niabella sp. 22666 TaxID=3453954 RepID=UPI003F836CAB